MEYPEHIGKAAEQILDFGCAESSNNRMELMAVVRALDWIRQNQPWADVSRVQIISDSKYVIDSIPAADEWRRLGWRNRHGEPRENVDLWKEFLRARRSLPMRVDFIQMKGKQSAALKAIDIAAKTAALRGGPDIDRGFRRGAISPSMLNGAAVPFPAQGQIASIRVYRKSVMPRMKGENKIRFDEFSETTQKYTGKFYAYSGPELAAKLHRQHGFRVRFNDMGSYPQILEILLEVALPPKPGKSVTMPRS